MFTIIDEMVVPVSPNDFKQGMDSAVQYELPAHRLAYLASAFHALGHFDCLPLQIKHNFDARTVVSTDVARKSVLEFIFAPAALHYLGKDLLNELQAIYFEEAITLYLDELIESSASFAAFSAEYLKTARLQEKTARMLIYRFLDPSFDCPQQLLHVRLFAYRNLDYLDNETHILTYAFIWAMCDPTKFAEYIMHEYSNPVLELCRLEIVIRLKATDMATLQRVEMNAARDSNGQASFKAGEDAADRLSVIKDLNFTPQECSLTDVYQNAKNAHDCILGLRISTGLLQIGARAYFPSFTYIFKFSLRGEQFHTGHFCGLVAQLKRHSLSLPYLNSLIATPTEALPPFLSAAYRPLTRFQFGHRVNDVATYLAPNPSIAAGEIFTRQCLPYIDTLSLITLYGDPTVEYNVPGMLFLHTLEHQIERGITDRIFMPMTGIRALYALAPENAGRIGTDDAFGGTSPENPLDAGQTGDLVQNPQIMVSVANEIPASPLNPTSQPAPPIEYTMPEGGATADKKAQAVRAAQPYSSGAAYVPACPNLSFCLQICAFLNIPLGSFLRVPQSLLNTLEIFDEKHHPERQQQFLQDLCVYPVVLTSDAPLLTLQFIPAFYLTAQVFFGLNLVQTFANLLSFALTPTPETLFSLIQPFYASFYTSRRPSYYAAEIQAFSRVVYFNMLHQTLSHCDDINSLFSLFSLHLDFDKYSAQTKHLLFMLKQKFFDLKRPRPFPRNGCELDAFVGSRICFFMSGEYTNLLEVGEAIQACPVPILFKRRLQVVATACLSQVLQQNASYEYDRINQIFFSNFQPPIALDSNTSFTGLVQQLQATVSPQLKLLVIKNLFLSFQELDQPPVNATRMALEVLHYNAENYVFMKHLLVRYFDRNPSFAALLKLCENDRAPQNWMFEDYLPAWQYKPRASVVKKWSRYKQFGRAEVLTYSAQLIKLGFMEPINSEFWE